MSKAKKHYVGIVGTGFIARGLMHALEYDSQLEVSYVLTRRQLNSVADLPIKAKQLTHDLNQLIKHSDVIVECSGDVIYGTEVVEHVLLAGLPVVTMNAELQLTTGSMLSRLGTLVEAEGDQPGTLASLDTEVRSMGFKPVVYGNIKGFLNHHPTPEEMEYWAKRQGIRLDKVTAFTDGTKVEIEQALVANGLGATLADGGMQALECTSFEDGAQRLGEMALEAKQVLSDYVVTRTGPAGVFIVATHDNEQAPYLEYLKLGTGPLYTITKPYHLCHLEIAKTIRQVLKGDPDYQFNNSQKPQVQVVAVAKKDLQPGEVINNGIGSFAVRGRAVSIADHQTAVPIGLLHQATVTKAVSQGQVVDYSQVSLPASRAQELWQAFLFEQYRSDVVRPNRSKSRSPYSKSSNALWYRFLRQTKFSNQPGEIQS